MRRPPFSSNFCPFCAVYARQLFSSGTCGCLGFDLTQGDDYLAILNSMILVPQLLENFDARTQRWVVDRMCSSPLALGDHVQVHAPFQPT